MNGRTRKIVFLCVIAAIIVFAASALAEKVIWKYSDDRGGIHFVEYLSQVPPKYRSKAVQVTLENTQSEQSGSEEPPKSSPPPASSNQTSTDAKKKEEWQNKARQAVIQAAGLGKEIGATETECQGLRRKATLAATIANRQAAAGCDKKLSDLKAALQKANEYLERGIFSDAENDGVPRSDVEDAIKNTKKELKN